MSKTKCSFNYNFSVPPAELVNGIRSGIEGNGGSFNGNDQSGSFDVKIKGLPKHLEGNYQINGNTITVNITKKPVVASCKRIQDEIGRHIPG